VIRWGKRDFSERPRFRGRGDEENITAKSLFSRSAKIIGYSITKLVWKYAFDSMNRSEWLKHERPN